MGRGQEGDRKETQNWGGGKNGGVGGTRKNRKRVNGRERGEELGWLGMRDRRETEK